MLPLAFWALSGFFLPRQDVVSHPFHLGGFVNVDGFVMGLLKLIGRLALRFWPLTLVLWAALSMTGGGGGGVFFLVFAVIVAVAWYGWRYRRYLPGSRAKTQMEPPAQQYHR